MTDRESLYCLIRKKWVAGTPEEQVRQRLLSEMVAAGYPEATLAVEKDLRQMPHLALNSHQQLPDRRADIVCFAKGIHPDHSLYPLLLVECKAEKQLALPVIQQAIGYNYFVQAYYLLIANHTQTKIGFYESAKQQYAFLEGLPTFGSLIKNRRLT